MFVPGGHAVSHEQWNHLPLEARVPCYPRTPPLPGGAEHLALCPGSLAWSHPWGDASPEVLWEI